MYQIEKHEDYLLVRFEEDFDYPLIRSVIHHVTSIKEYPCTNDIWLIGKHRANIRLGELETMMREFHCRCPRNATRAKMAVVVETGMTEALIELWVSACRKKVPFQMRIFHSLAEARLWLAPEQEQCCA